MGASREETGRRVGQRISVSACNHRLAFTIPAIKRFAYGPVFRALSCRAGAKQPVRLCSPTGRQSRLDECPNRGNGQWNQRRSSWASSGPSRCSDAIAGELVHEPLLEVSDGAENVEDETDPGEDASPTLVLRTNLPMTPSNTW